MPLVWFFWCVLAVACVAVGAFERSHWGLSVVTGILYIILVVWLVIIVSISFVLKRKCCVKTQDQQQEKAKPKVGFLSTLLVQYPFVMLLGVSVVSWCASWHLFAEMLTHFTWQLMLGWFYLCGATLVVRNYKLFVVSVLMMGTFALQIAPFYSQKPVTNSHDKQRLPLSMMHYNVQGNNPNHEGIVQWIEQHHPDVVLLQETSHAWEKWVERLKVIYPHQLTNYMSDSFFGAVLLSKYPLKNVKIEEMGEKWNYYFSANLQIDVTHAVQLYAIHTHPPFGEKGADIRNRQLRHLAQVMNDKYADTSVVMGDLNITPYSPYFKEFLSQTGLQNSMLGYGIQNSWPTDLPLWLMGIAIDHVLVSSNIEVKVRELGENLGSDHLPVLVKIYVPKVK